MVLSFPLQLVFPGKMTFRSFFLIHHQVFRGERELSRRRLCRRRRRRRRRPRRRCADVENDRFEAYADPVQLPLEADDRIQKSETGTGSGAVEAEPETGNDLGREVFVAIGKISSGKKEEFHQVLQVCKIYFIGVMNFVPMTFVPMTFVPMTFVPMTFVLMTFVPMTLNPKTFKSDNFCLMSFVL
jgi:hypothetical protein